MSTPYIPRMVESADRDAAVARLRSGLESGQLDTSTYQRRVDTVLAARTQDDLDAAVMDLPPVATSGTFELYPHQTVAAYEQPVNPNAPDPTPSRQPRRDPDQPMSFKVGNVEVSNIPSWVIPTIALVALFGFMALTGTWWLWWLIFFIPGGVWGGSSKSRRMRREHPDWYHDKPRKD